MTAIEELWEMIDRTVPPLPSVSRAPHEALRWCLATDAVAPGDLPPFDHSAMDGYAFAGPERGPCAVAGEVRAGTPHPRGLGTGEVLRIFTGAPVPEGVFAVARQEDCGVENGRVHFKRPEPLIRGENIRRQGGVARAGSVLVRPGTPLTPGAIAHLIAAGVREINVHQRPRVMHIATGSELLAPGAPARPGAIPDSNGPMIEALLALRGLSVHREQLGDDSSAIGKVVSDFDGELLLISGGSGPGDHDHTDSALRHAGYEIHTRRIDSRPGKPMIFATRGRRAAFGLPGNPLSHWVCHHAFVRRAIARFEGYEPPCLSGALCPGWNVPVGDGRRTWTPARLSAKSGELVAKPLHWLHSGDLSPLVEADALLLDEPDPITHLVRFLPI